MLRAGFFCCLALTLAIPGRSLTARQAAPPVIDTVIIVTENVFSPEEVRRNSGFGIVNGMRFKTRSYVVRRELLFRAGEQFDLERIAETARNLRSLGLFRYVEIDTTRVDGRFAVRVRTRDGWSTQVQLNAASTGGTLTWSAGLTETNFIGSGNLASATYRKGVDRNSWTLAGRANRVLGSRIRATGAWQHFTDGWSSVWLAGVPWRAFGDRASAEVFGERMDRRVLQFRTRSITDADTTQYQRRAFRNGFVAAYAPIAEGSRYLRVGITGDLRREEYILRRDTAAGIPDSVFASFGVFAEYRMANFQVVNYFNGFGLQEDLDLGTTVRVAARMAPSAFGYERTGFGPSAVIATAARLPFGYLRAAASANGVFDAGGLDSGRVDARVVLAVKPARRHATFLLLAGGLQEAPPPGEEFDLGLGVGPRSFGPHAFTGTRTVWGILEHRWFIVDDLFRILGLGLAAFLDYGGAWYPDQAARYGGNVGFGIRTGFNRATGANTGRIDLGYRFGEGFGKRWAVSFGRGFVF